MQDIKKKTRETLSTLIELFDGCTIAMLVDQETGLVLSNCTKAFVPQNVLDALAHDAQRQARSKSMKALSEKAEAPKTLMIAKYAKNTIVVTIVDQRGGADALVCQFDSMPNRKDLLAAASEVFDLTPSVEAA